MRDAGLDLSLMEKGLSVETCEDGAVAVAK